MISVLMEGARLVNEAFCFWGVLRSNSIVIAACEDSHPGTHRSNNASGVKAPLQD